MNPNDPLDNMGGFGGDTTEIRPTPDPIEFPHPLVSQRSEEDLGEYGQNIIEDYRDFKLQLLSWLHAYGKDPEKGNGLAMTTLESTHYKLETAFRWLWMTEEKYTKEFTPTHADDFIEGLAHSPSMIESTVHHHAKDIKRLFKFSNHVQGKNYDWSPEIELSQSGTGDERQYLRRDAFKPLYEAALNHSSVKSYHNKNMSAEERDQLKTFVSQRLGIPKENVGPEEFKQANTWKYPSMIATTLDTGLRPIEVGRATVGWVNLDDNELTIPKDESSKNEGHWNCAIKQQTANALSRWLDERDSYDKYDGTDALWLTQQAKPYSSSSCNALLERIRESGNVPIPENQDFSWYSIRHGVATMWANKIGPHHAKEQLRHKNVKTTMKYLHSNAEKRGSAVEHTW